MRMCKFFFGIKMLSTKLSLHGRTLNRARIIMGVRNRTQAHHYCASKKATQHNPYCQIASLEKKEQRALMEIAMWCGYIRRKTPPIPTILFVTHACLVGRVWGNASRQRCEVFKLAETQWDGFLTSVLCVLCAVLIIMEQIRKKAGSLLFSSVSLHASFTAATFLLVGCC